MKRITLAFATLRAAAMAAVLLPSFALAQSSPGLYYGQVPTAAQWNAYFASKQDALGFVPVNKAGDTMLGPLVTFAPTTASAGFNLPQGTAPSAPSNGDLWTTSAGLFVQINGNTVGPFVGAGSSTFAGNAPLSVAFPSGVITYSLNYDSTFALSDNKLALAPIASGALLGNSSGSAAEPAAVQTGSGVLAALENPLNGSGGVLGTSLASTDLFIGNASGIATGVPMSGDATISSAGALTLANSGVTAGTYGDGTHSTQVTFDAKGRATAASSVTITHASGDLLATNNPYGLTSATVLSPGTGYVPGDTYVPAISGAVAATPNGLSYLGTGGQFSVTATQVVSASVVSGGSACTGTTATLTGTTGSATSLFTATAPISGGAIIGPVIITFGGQYKTNPTNLSAEPVTGSGCSGATLNVVMGAAYLQPINPGYFTTIPALAGSATQASTSGSGTGLTATVYFAPIASYILPQSQASGTTTASYVWDTVQGFQALINRTTGNENTAFGWNAGYAVTTGSQNAAFGVGALSGNTGEATGPAEEDTAIGNDAMRNGVSLTASVAVGNHAMYNVLTADDDIENTAVGAFAMQGDGLTTTGVDFNTAVGGLALGGTSFNGKWDTGIGEHAGLAITSGANNSLFGGDAGQKITTGNFDLCLGFLSCGSILTTGSRNIVIGSGANTGCDTATASTNDSFVLCANSGTTPLLSGNLASGSLALTVNGSLTSQSFTPSSLATPTSGLFLFSANEPAMAANGVSAMIWTPSNVYFQQKLTSITSGGAVVETGAASATVPTLVPASNAQTSGIGADATGDVSVIVSSVDAADFKSGGLTLHSLTTAGLVTTTSGGLLGSETGITPAQCPAATSSAIGCAKPDGTTITVSGGVLTAVGAATTSIDAGGATSVTNGTPGGILIDNGGKVGMGVAASSLVQNNVADQTISGGANLTSFNLGTLSSATTIDCGKNNNQYFTNGGAFTLTAPANDGTCYLLDTNGASAGAITFSGFTEGSNTGDPLDTTSGHQFGIMINRTNGISHYLVTAYQ